MNTISINYTIEYELSFSPNYVWLNDKSCYNIKSGRRLKQCYNSGSIGYYIKGKFYSLKFLRSHLRKPIKIKLPF